MASSGDIRPSSLVASAPASDVAFDGTEELAGVLPLADAFPGPTPLRRMILTAVVADCCDMLAARFAAIVLKGVGLVKLAI